MNRIVINMVPVAKGRPRFSRKSWTTYTPSKTRDATETMGILMNEQWRAEPIDEPIAVGFRFYMPCPKKWSQKTIKEMVGLPHTETPDLDNLIKLVMDAGNGILWTDDKLIWAYDKSFKVYSEQPRVEIYVNAIVGTN